MQAVSHRFRKWLKDLLQYGRRGVQSSGDEKPPLLWLADLPRLGSMWAGHLWFRMWLDLRGTPPRVTYDPREVFSPHVASVRPTRLNPIRPLRRTREVLAACRAWLAEGGLERAVAKLGTGLVGGIAGLFAAVALGLANAASAVATGVAGVFGASAIGTALGLNAIAGGVRGAAKRTGVGVVRLRDGLAAGFTALAGRFRSPREIAWTFATLTGTVGLILLMVLQSNGLPAAQKQTAAATHTAQRPPVAVAQEEPEADDPFGGLPDPFGAPEPAAGPELEEDPFGPVAQPEPAADLEVEVARSDLPAEVARFNLPDDDERFVVESHGADTVPDLRSFPKDDWLLASPRPELGRLGIVPAAYREPRDAVPVAVRVPRPSSVADRFTPATRSVGVTVTKTQPAEAKAGELLWYDLVVTNRTREEIAGVIVEEHVAEPHRVANARPAAAFADGTLSWKLEALRPGEEKRLSVGVYPMSADPIVTAAAVRPVATFSTVTLVQEEPEDEPITEPAPGLGPEPTDEPLRRVRIAMTTPERVTSGAGCVIRFRVTNTGGAPLTGVAIRGLLPERLRHAHGAEVESDIGPLAPGESRTAEMHVTAGRLGEAELLAEVSSAEGVATTVRGAFDVVDSLPRTPSFPACCCPVGMIETPAR